MVRIEGSGRYVGGDTHLSLPMYDQERPKREPRPKPAPFNWDDHRAPDSDIDQKPNQAEVTPNEKCRGCRKRYTLDALVDGFCDGCVIANEERAALAAAKRGPHIEEAQSGQPLTGNSAPGADTASENSRRARDAGASAHEKDPSEEQETRPVPPTALVEQLELLHARARVLADELLTVVERADRLRGAIEVLLPELVAQNPTRNEDALSAVRVYNYPLVTVPAHLFEHEPDPIDVVKAAQTEALQESVRQAPPSIPAIREWARANGFQVSDRGRLPREVFEAYGDAFRGR